MLRYVHFSVYVTVLTIMFCRTGCSSAKIADLIKVTVVNSHSHQFGKVLCSVKSLSVVDE